MKGDIITDGETKECFALTSSKGVQILQCTKWEKEHVGEKNNKIV
jgi:hypothetical protein